MKMLRGVWLTLSLSLCGTATALTIDELSATGGNVGCFPAPGVDVPSARLAAIYIAAEAAGIGKTSLTGRTVDVKSADNERSHENLSMTTVITPDLVSGLAVLAEGMIGDSYCVSAMF